MLSLGSSGVHSTSGMMLSGALFLFPTLSQVLEHPAPLRLCVLMHWRVALTTPHLFIFLDLEEIIIFKLLPLCLCCRSNIAVGWPAQEA